MAFKYHSLERLAQDGSYKTGNHVEALTSDKMNG